MKTSNSGTPGAGIAKGLAKTTPLLGACFALVTIATGPAAVSSCSSSSGAGLSSTCSINSDCNSPLICAFTKCHAACHESRDCSAGERCVVSGANGVCELPAETVCTMAGAACVGTLVCGSDQQCGTPCQTTTQCLNAQSCVPLQGSSPSGTCIDQPGELDGGETADGGGTAQDGTANSGDGSGIGGGNQCPSAQTQFGNIAQGDSNPNFTSGVGVRGAKQLLIFSGYAGPPAGAGDAGDAGDAGSVNLVYVQSFDPVTGKSQASAVPLFQAADGAEFTVDDVSIAPTGQIALLYSTGPADKNAVYASFFTSVADAGAAGLQLVQTVQVESAPLVYASDPYFPHPHAIWSTANKAFVFSWEYGATNLSVQPTLKVVKYLPTGGSAGGGTNAVPVPMPPSIFWAYDQGSVGTSGNLVGVIYGQNSPYYPFLTILDAQGNQVGGAVQLSSVSLNANWSWLSVAGTANGFTSFFAQNGTVYEVFTPTSTDAGVLAPAPVDGGDAGAFGGFQFLSTAIAGRSISDDTGGVGGTGTVLLEQNGASFIYVNADGIRHVGPTTIIAHTYAGGDQVAVTNFGGSFGVSLYGRADHATKIAASGCSP